MSTLQVDNINTSAGATAISIDSGGRILTPARPAFRVEKRASAQSLTSNSTTKVTFEHEAFDIGSNFSSNKFTVPIAGIYHFEACLGVRPSNGDVDGGNFVRATSSLYKNGTKITELVQIKHYANSLGGGYSNLATSHINGSATLSLSANDYIEVYVNVQASSPEVSYASDGSKTFFSGFLVG